MIDFFLLSDEEYECLAKAIAIGVAIGIVIGMFFDYVIIGFSAGGIVGILISLIYIVYKKIIKGKNKQ